MTKYGIVDTDPGGDSDDALALLLFLNSPELFLELVVTNDEHEGHRALFIQQWRDIMKKTFLVSSGIDLGRDKYCLIEEMLTYHSSVVDDAYLDRIAEVVEHNDMTHYVCIGPQSNLAEFIKAFPEYRDKVKITIMGGGLEGYRLGTSRAEYNIRQDVPAARTVFYSDWDKRYVIGDVTMSDHLRVGERSEIFAAMDKDDRPHMKYLVRSMRHQFDKSKHDDTVMHDPLTVSTLFADYVKFNTRNVEMDENGIMRPKPDGKPTVVAVKVDYKGFRKMFDERILV
jgi:purine nucleosidase/pyrimidine-specific ribonucleoside hydrolase